MEICDIVFLLDWFEMMGNIIKGISRWIWNSKDEHEYHFFPCIFDFDTLLTRNINEYYDNPP